MPVPMNNMTDLTKVYAHAATMLSANIGGIQLMDHGHISTFARNNKEGILAFLKGDGNDPRDEAE